MINITSYSVEKVKDPFGILSGQRYEYKLELEVPEDDELYSERGIYIRAIYVVDEDRSRMVKYDFHESGTDTYLDFDMEEDEEAAVEAFCRERLSEAEEGQR